MDHNHYYWINDFTGLLMWRIIIAPSQNFYWKYHFSVFFCYIYIYTCILKFPEVYAELILLVYLNVSITNKFSIELQVKIKSRGDNATGQCIPKKIFFFFYMQYVPPFDKTWWKKCLQSHYPEHIALVKWR